MTDPMTVEEAREIIAEWKALPDTFKEDMEGEPAAQYREAEAFLEGHAAGSREKDVEIDKLNETLRRLDEDDKHDHSFAQNALDLEEALKAEREAAKGLVSLVEEAVRDGVVHASFFDRAPMQLAHYRAAREGGNVDAV